MDVHAARENPRENTTEQTKTIEEAQQEKREKRKERGRAFAVGFLAALAVVGPIALVLLMRFFW